MTGAAGSTLAPLAELATVGGKRLRAQSALAGAAVAIAAQDASVGKSAPDPASLLSRAADLPGMVDLACALELYQASALAHDDWFDDSPLRRGQQSAHVALAERHAQTGGPGEPAQFGAIGAVLLGNYLTAAAHFALAGASFTEPSQLLFAQMEGEVAQGQFLDVSAGYSPIGGSSPVESALEVIRLKSALYSVVRPAQLGALLAGSESVRCALEPILEPLGLAFQLRDDDLGAFGDVGQTGKPNASDVRERKRTVLAALAWQGADHQGRAFLDEVYSKSQVDDGLVAGTVRLLGAARGRHEAMIAAYESEFEEQLSLASLPAAAVAVLQGLSERLTKRDR